MRMKFVFALFLLLASQGVLVYAEDPSKKPTKGDDDVAAIRAEIDSYVAAYNAGDANRVADHWSESAVYIRADSGERVLGRKAIAKVFGEIFAGGERPKLRVKVDSIRLITADVAIEDGVADVVSASGTAERSTYTAVHVKGKSGWKLDSVRETETPVESEAPAGYEKLKELEWLLGNWIDSSADATVEYSANWAKEKSFIVRLFQVSVPGAVELEGTQVIGWDADSKSIRSWVFDSAGGFSEGSWSRKGDSWVITSKGYGPDGRRTSSVATIKQIDAKSFNWSVSKREVGGEKLPDIDNIQVVRK